MIQHSGSLSMHMNESECIVQFGHYKLPEILVSSSQQDWSGRSFLHPTNLKPAASPSRQALCFVPRGLPYACSDPPSSKYVLYHPTSLAGQTFEERRERLVTVVDFPCARGISLTASLTCCHETNMR